MDQLLAREEHAWRTLAPAAYETEVCRMLDDLGPSRNQADCAEALLALVTATLGRESPLLSEAPACCAKHLIGTIAATREGALRARFSALLLLAWSRLAALVAQGPVAIAVSPSLPPGVVLPDGASPNEIADPKLREQAREAARIHRKTAQRWNAKQRALGHLNRLVEVALGAARGGAAGGHNAMTELLSALSLQPGIPVELRQRLAEAAEQRDF